MKYTLIFLAKILAKLIYAFLKLLPVKRKITLISRFNKKTSIDFKLLINEIKRRDENIEIIVLNHKLRTRNLLIIDVLIEMYHIATSKVCIIDSYIIPISTLRHKKSLTVIQIWHSIGVSKNFGFTALGLKEGANKKLAKIMNMHKNYDYIIASGETSIEYYQKSFNVEKDIIKNIGLPRIDYLLDLEEKEKIKKKLKNKYNLNNTKKTITYSPTFRKGKKIPYENIINNVDLSKYNLVIKKHHLDKTSLHDDRIINMSEEEMIGVLFITDYLITDYSALMFEAAILEIPMFFYIYDFDTYQERRGLTLELKDLPGLVSNNELEIIEAIKNNFYSREKIKMFKNAHIDNLDMNATKRIVDLVEGGL